MRISDWSSDVCSSDLVCRGISPTARMPDSLSRGGEKRAPSQARQAYFGSEHGWQHAPVMTRAELTAAPVSGPLMVEEYDTPSVVRPGWTARLDAATTN